MPSRNPEPDGIDRAKAMKAIGWRNSPVTDLDATDDVFRILRLSRVKTIGELCDKLRGSGFTTMSTADANDLKDQIEQCSADDPEPVEFDRMESEPSSITCPACGSNADTVDNGEFGCTKEGCGWLGSEKDAEAFVPQSPQPIEGPNPMAKTKRPKNQAGAQLDLGVKFGNVNIGDTTCRLGVTLDRNGEFPITKADKTLCGRRLIGRIVSAAGNANAEQPALFEAGETISGAFDVKTLGITPKHLSFGLTFAIESVDIDALAHFAKRSGRLQVDEVTDIPEADKGEDEEDEDE